MITPQEWHHCAQFAGDAGAVDIVSDGKEWELRDPEYHHGAVFQHGTTLTVVYCPFCGVRLAAEESRPATEERLLGPAGQWYTVEGGWHGGTIEEG